MARGWCGVRDLRGWRYVRKLTVLVRVQRPAHIESFFRSFEFKLIWSTLFSDPAFSLSPSRSWSSGSAVLRFLLSRFASTTTSSSSSSFFSSARRSLFGRPFGYSECSLFIFHEVFLWSRLKNRFMIRFMSWREFYLNKFSIWTDCMWYMYRGILNYWSITSLICK